MENSFPNPTGIQIDVIMSKMESYFFWIIYDNMQFYNSFHIYSDKC